MESEPHIHALPPEAMRESAEPTGERELSPEDRALLDGLMSAPLGVTSSPRRRSSGTPERPQAPLGRCEA